MDTEVGEIVAKLKEDGLLENTFIFYYGDHGGVLPGSKGYINEMGVHVPMVVYIPPKYEDLVTVKIGTQSDAFVSFVDLGATVLHLAGVEVPEFFDGKPFLGKGISQQDLEVRDETFSYADRFDEKYDMVRALRKGKYKYVRNYQPFNFDGLMNNYRYKQLGYQQWKQLYDKKELNKVQSQLFEPNQPEELYDLEADPNETRNLAQLPEHQKKLLELRERLNDYVTEMPDLSFYPEFFLRQHAFENPIAFGQNHIADIQRYSRIADAMLLDFDDAKSELQKSLISQDRWERYWALIACSAFGHEAIAFIDQIKKIAKEDSELINQVRATEFLGLINAENPGITMTKALYQSKDGAEALLILNSIVLMQDGQGYEFNIDKNNLDEVVLKEQQVVRRLEYLGVITAN